MKRYFLFYLLICSVFTATAQNYYVGKSPDGVEEMFIQSVTSNRSTNSLVVFDRLKPVEGRLGDFRHNAKTMADGSVKTKNFDKLGFYRRKVQFSCSAKKYRVMECTYFEVGGKEIDAIEFDSKETQWLPIPKGSLEEIELKKICR